MSRAKIRCAIYTRKSSEEGLDQSFNSLDAQYAACASYIASQRHEGWKLIKKRYDDGGISGGTLDRPGVQGLLDEIDAGLVDMVVVYKIDRLTRSLADFAKLVERLEAANCSFVSVTQAFNTSSSMGRLTLNVLLSFAQFEREVTAERIRDKIAASKKKGLWMGGVCPLGYDKHPDPSERTLVINQVEADVVRKLFELYDQHGCLQAVKEAADERKIVSKRRIFSSGRSVGGKPLSRGQVYYILRNPLYLGQIRHRDKTYPGRHSAIIDQALWDRVQQKLSDASNKARGITYAPSGATNLLAGIIFDETGDRLTPTYATKGSKRYRYYVSNRLIGGTPDPSAWRLPAADLERQVKTLVADHLEAHAKRMTICHGLSLDQLAMVNKTAMELATKIISQSCPTITEVIAKIELSQKDLAISLTPVGICKWFKIKEDQLDPVFVKFSTSLQLKKRGVERKIVIGDYVSAPDQTLLKLLDQAHAWVDQLKAGTQLKAIAEREGVTPAYIRTRSKLAFLAPRVQEAILDGSIDPKFTAGQIIAMKIPLDWDKQVSLLLSS
jgi:site-specific DNA recombinase